MSPDEIRRRLTARLNEYRRWTYAQLAERVKSDHRRHECLEVLDGEASDGTPYTIELNALWDDRADGNIRVTGSLSVQPMKPVFPFMPVYAPDLTDSFILSPDGRVVGE